MPSTTGPLWVLLRQRRRALGLTTRAAADACGVSQPAYSRWENGRVPDDAYLAGVADFLGLTRSEVVLVCAGEDPADGITDELASLRLRLDEIEKRLPPPGIEPGVR